MALRFAVQDGGQSGLLFADQSQSLSGTISGNGALQAQSASVVGVAEREITDVGTPPDFETGVVTVVGSGVVERVGSGVLAAQVASVSGVGEVTDSLTVTGSGAVAAQSATTTGVAEREIIGGGSLAAQTATASGSGAIGYTGDGTLAAQDATIAGTAERIVEAGGVGLLSGAATVSSNGIVGGTIAGTGAITADAAEVLANGYRSSLGVASLLAQSSIVSGVGLLNEFDIDFGERFLIDSADIRITIDGSDIRLIL